MYKRRVSIIPNPMSQVTKIVISVKIKLPKPFWKSINTSKIYITWGNGVGFCCWFSVLKRHRLKTAQHTNLNPQHATKAWMNLGVQKLISVSAAVNMRSWNQNSETSDGLSEARWNVILQEVSTEETALPPGHDDKLPAHILQLEEHHFGSL